MFANSAFRGRATVTVLTLAHLAGCGNAEKPPSLPNASSRSVVQDRASKAVSPPPRPTRAAAPRGKDSLPRTEQVFRPDDDRPRHDDAALEQAGIRKFVSRRLVLYTDIDEHEAVRLPPLVDALYDELVSYFGELPPARDGADWQITGYLMRETERFRAAGLVPTSLPAFHHGLNRRRRFWMREQSLEHYLQHLLLHEATHCFMTTLPVPSAPPWYMEGMAEHFATHRMLPDGKVVFRVIPAMPDEMQGFDRVTLIRKEVDAGRALSFESVLAIDEAAYLEPLPYAWSWAACLFLDAQPEYRERFRELGDAALRAHFPEEFDRRFDADRALVDLKWQFFVQTLCYGYDLSRAVLPIEVAGENSRDIADVKVKADAGWQSMKLRLKAGERCELAADGQVSLADAPIAWISDANGITIDYADGKPAGRLLAAVVGDDLHQPAATGTLFEPVDIGSKSVLKAPIDGTLYLRINDAWNRLADNRGELSVHVRRMDD
jgi:hypothetical protein